MPSRISSRGRREGLRLELDALWEEVDQLGAEEGEAPEEDQESLPR
ncbi:hypothetical protein [Sorangium sp. So ce381]